MSNVRWMPSFPHPLCRLSNHQPFRHFVELHSSIIHDCDYYWLPENRIIRFTAPAVELIHQTITQKNIPWISINSPLTLVSRKISPKLELFRDIPDASIFQSISRWCWEAISKGFTWWLCINAVDLQPRHEWQWNERLGRSNSIVIRLLWHIERILKSRPTRIAKKNQLILNIALGYYQW